MILLLEIKIEIDSGFNWHYEEENIVSENNKLQLCEEFLEYLIDKYAMFERKAESDPHYSGIGDYINIKGVVAEYFGTEEL